jgi:hypothetical protein
VLDQKCFAVSGDGTGEQFVIQMDSHGGCPASNDGDTNWQYAGSLRKRTRQDATPRTLPCSDSGDRSPVRSTERSGVCQLSIQGRMAIEIRRRERGKAGSLRKRTRQDATPRTLPCSDSGLPQAKRRATVCDMAMSVVSHPVESVSSGFQRTASWYPRRWRPG